MKNNTFQWILLILAILAIVSVIIYLIIASFDTARSPDTSEGDPSDIKVAAVGDSTTYGLMIDRRSENSYPAQLAGLLGESYWVGNFGANNYAAMKSADFPYLETDVYKESLEFNPDIVVLMLGTNDSKDTNWRGNEQFKEEYSELVDSYIENNPETKIYLATPPKAFNEASRSGDINNENINKVAEVVKEVSGEKDTGFIDINQLTQDKRQWFQLDGIHPNAEGAENIADEVHQHITE